MTIRWLLVLMLLAGFAGTAAPAQPPAASAALRSRAEQVVAMLRGQADPATMFTSDMLAEVPAARLRTIAQQLVAQYGAVQGVQQIEARTPDAGVVQIATERAVLHVQLVVQPQPPHLIAGLLFAGADMRGDTLDAVIAEIRALPGETSVAVARLGETSPAVLASLAPERPLAIGSAFKLFILAELNREIAAGQRRWSDVVALDRHSIPSGTLQAWPLGSPLTLHTLAALMISVSDNSAADLLLRTLGRENVERMMTTIGVASAARNRPLLSTLEMAALKAGPAPRLNAWLQADERGRRAMLAGELANADAAEIDISRFAGNPIHIDAVEWFASPADLVRVMDWLRRHGDETVRAILAINSGLGPAASGFAYVGYKGGSEPGVLNLTWLIQSRAGTWYVVTGSWNDRNAPVDEQRFFGLMVRALPLLRN